MRHRQLATLWGRSIFPRADADRRVYLPYNTWGTDHFGFLYQGDLTALCADLRKKGASFPVELKKGVGGSLLCYVAAPDGVGIELMQC